MPPQGALLGIAAPVEGAMIGLAIADLSRDEPADIWYLAVFPNYHRRGVGTRLVRP